MYTDALKTKPPLGDVSLFDTLPNELLELILTFLGDPSVRAVCRRWNGLWKAGAIKRRVHRYLHRFLFPYPCSPPSDELNTVVPAYTDFHPHRLLGGATIEVARKAVRYNGKVYPIVFHDFGGKVTGVTCGTKAILVHCLYRAAELFRIDGERLVQSIPIGAMTLIPESDTVVVSVIRRDRVGYLEWTWKEVPVVVQFPKCTKTMTVRAGWGKICVVTDNHQMWVLDYTGKLLKTHVATEACESVKVWRHGIAWVGYDWQQARLLLDWRRTSTTVVSNKLLPRVTRAGELFFKGATKDDTYTL